MVLKHLESFKLSPENEQFVQDFNFHCKNNGKYKRK